MILSIIVAVAEDNGIGKDNQLLWRLPADLKHFKTITTGHPVIMGRKTYESVGRPLPNRRNIVITRNTNLDIPGVEIVHGLQEAIDLCDNQDEAFIIGGAEIYKSALQLTDKIYLTVVKGTFDADAFFPPIDTENWTETAVESFEADEKNTWAYTFSTLIRK